MSEYGEVGRDSRGALSPDSGGLSQHQGNCLLLISLTPPPYPHSIQPPLCQQNHFSRAQIWPIHFLLLTQSNLNSFKIQESSELALIYFIDLLPILIPTILKNVFIFCHYFPPPPTPLTPQHLLHSCSLWHWLLYLGLSGLKCSFPCE